MGTVWTWDNNAYCRAGDGTTNQHSSATRVPGLSGVVAIGAGIFHCVALKSDWMAQGDVWAWGYNQSGQLGNGMSGSGVGSELSPVRVLGARSVAGAFYLMPGAPQ